MKEDTYVMYSDGAARGNPGPAGCGIVVKKGEDIFLEIAVYLKKMTNNQAEYLGLYFGLLELQKRKVSNVVCMLDSELIVRQMQGVYKVKNKELKEVYSLIHTILKDMSVTFMHVVRAKNTKADALANYAVDHGKEKGDTFIRTKQGVEHVVSAIPSFSQQATLL